MGKPFDASPKALLQLRPADWPAFVGVAAHSVEVVDADVSTVTAATDKVLLVHAAEGDRIQHFDFQSGPDAGVPRRTHGYNALLEDRHQLPVDSTVVLLASKANLKAINGVYERRLPGEKEPYLRFRYRVIRVWDVPVETVLTAGLSVLPLAPLSKVQRDRLPKVIERMEERFASLAEPAIVGELWTATKVLMGLRYSEEFTERLLRGVRAMKESVTYQAIVEEGRLAEARSILLAVGKDRFKGPPAADQLAVIEGIDDPSVLQKLVVRAGHVDSWAEVLESETAAKPRRRKKS